MSTHGSRVVHLEERGRPLIFEDATEADPRGVVGPFPGTTGAVPGPRLAAIACGHGPLLHPRWTADPLAADPTLAPLLPALHAWAAVPGGVVVTEDALLARVLVDRFGLDVVAPGVAVAGPTLVIPPFVDRGPSAVDAVLDCFARGRAILPDLRARWLTRRWLGGWAELDAALADLDARCPPGPLHMLSVRARRPDLLAPPAPALVLELWATTDRVGSARLTAGSVCIGSPVAGVGRNITRVVHPAWPAELESAVRLDWRRDGLRVRLEHPVDGFRVFAGAASRGERTPLSPGDSVPLGLRGTVEVFGGDDVIARLDVRPEVLAPAELPPTVSEPAIGLADRRVLVDVVVDVAESTAPFADALGTLLARHESPGGAALAARLGRHPVGTLGRWLGDDRNEPLRLAIADALAQTDDPIGLRARLPKAVRCWIPRLRNPRRRQQQGLRLVVS